MTEKRRGKKQLEEAMKLQRVFVTQNNFFKGFTTEGIRNYDQKIRSSAASLTVASHGNLQAVEDFWSVDRQHHLP